MKNKSPIFINAFARGGSNIVWNLFQSHPDVCSPIYETHEIFQYNRSRMMRHIGKINDVMIPLLSGQPRFFKINNYSPRRKIPKIAMLYVDFCLFKAKQKNLSHEYNKYKTEHLNYTDEEVKNSRLVSKNLNGIIFLTDIFYEMYPDATFISLVRNGFALCESYLRRGTVSSASEFGKMYKIIAQKMIQDSKKIRRYYTVKFEDIVSNPVKSLKLLYNYANLNLNDVQKIRLKVKPHFKKTGKRTRVNIPGEKVWLDFDELNDFLDPNVNEYQINRLNNRDKNDFMKVAHEVMTYFSYD